MAIKCYEVAQTARNCNELQRVMTPRPWSTFTNRRVLDIHGFAASTQYLSIAFNGIQQQQVNINRHGISWNSRMCKGQEHQKQSTRLRQQRPLSQLGLPTPSHDQEVQQYHRLSMAERVKRLKSNWKQFTVNSLHTFFSPFHLFVFKTRWPTWWRPSLIGLAQKSQCWATTCHTTWHTAAYSLCLSEALGLLRFELRLENCVATKRTRDRRRAPRLVRHTKGGRCQEPREELNENVADGIHKATARQGQP